MITIEKSRSLNPHLRFYTGTYERRHMMLPVYHDQRADVVSHHVESNDTVEIFMVRGYGSTRAKSEAMARGAK